MTPLAMIGVRPAPDDVATRSLVGLEPAAVTSVLADLANRCPDHGFVLLSTCARTELYISGPGYDGVTEAATALLRSRARDPEALPERIVWTQRTGTDAVRHLIRVACGLDSAILGDVQLPAQIREAQSAASGAGTLDDTLRDLIRVALQTARRARRETTISCGAPGIASAVTDALDECLVVDPAEATILLVGAGQAAASIARRLAKTGYRDVVIVNRSLPRARALASRHGFVAAPMPMMPAYLGRVDAAITATHSPSPLLTRALVESIVVERRSAEPLVVIDAGMPPNAERATGVVLRTLDDLDQQTVDHTELRLQAIPAVEAMIEESVRNWVTSRELQGLHEFVRALYESSADVARDIAQSVLTLEEPELAERVVHRSLKRMLHRNVCEVRERMSAQPVSI